MRPATTIHKPAFRSAGRLLAVLLTGAAISVIAASAAAAGQSITVLGKSRAASCYEAALFGRGDRTALATCDSALDEDALLKRDRAKTHVNRGIVRKNRGDIEGALEDFEEALRRAPELGEAHLNIGFVRYQRRDWQGAVAELTTGLELDPNAAHRGYFVRGLAREELGDVRGAWEDYNAALEAAPDFGPAKRELERFSVSTEKTNGA